MHGTENDQLRRVQVQVLSLFTRATYTYTNQTIYVLAPPGPTGHSTKGVGSYNGNSKGQMILLALPADASAFASATLHVFSIIWLVPTSEDHCGYFYVRLRNRASCMLYVLYLSLLSVGRGGSNDMPT